MDIYSHHISPPLPSPVPSGAILQSQPTLLPPSSILSDPVPILHVLSQPSLTSIPQQLQSSASQDIYSPSEMELFLELDLPPVDTTITTTDFSHVINVFDVRKRSCSRKNFCANLVRELFTKEQMKTSNVKGVFEKMRLDPQKISFVEKTAFQLYPLVESETTTKAWTACIRSIDEACRRLNRSK